MTTLTIFSLAMLIFATALLYSSVGHGGASGYLAVMALLGIAPDVMKPTALVLNILVAGIATFKFYRAGYFSWSILFPFAITSIPFSFIGGGVTLPASLYKPIVGVMLLYAAYRLFQFHSMQTATAIKPIPLWVGLVAGGGIGLLSGLTGTGGGIFLSPLLLFLGWADSKQTSSVSAAFVLANSTSGLLGHLSSVAVLPTALPIWAIAALIGGSIGAEYGSKRLSNTTLGRLLALVLLIAGLKMILA